MRKIAIIHPNLMRKGGGEYVALNFLEGLKEDYDLTLITGVNPDFEELNQAFKTEITKKELDVKLFPYFSFMRKCFLLRKAIFRKSVDGWIRFHEDEYYKFISVVDEFPLPAGQGIQYIHCPIKEIDFKGKGQSLRKKIYLKLSDLLMPLQEDRVINNLTLCNSKWTRKKFEEHYSKRAKVLNPPVRDDFPEILWKERENGFVNIGRIAPCKRQDLAIRIIDKLKNRGLNVHLHILGGESNPQYSKKIVKMAEERDYITYEGFVSRERLTQIVANHKFGLHCMKNERYGIAPAEMVRAGCITFIHNSGGQKYIVDQNEDLLFDNLEEAVSKIERMLKNKELQERTLERLDESKPNTPEEFQEKVREMI